MKRTLATICAAVLLITALAGCSGGGGGNAGGVQRTSLTFADAGWDSIGFHNAVAGFIAETAFGYESWSNLTGSTPVTYEGLLKGEIDAYTEIWTDNLPTYDEDVAAGKFHELGVNFDDNMQGLYVPRYVIEGDSSRGIAPLAPDLKTVEDLIRYKDVFPDDENPERGRIYGAIPGWEVDTIMYNKYLYYGLDKEFEYFRPGSEAAIYAAFTAAYTKGEPIVGYNWEPTWLMGMYDFVLLEDAPYDPALYKEGKCACPAVRVTVVASNSLMERDPEFCEFLSKYHTSSALTSEALSYMQETNAGHTDTAKWFLKQHDELIDQFLTAEQAQKVRDALT